MFHEKIIALPHLGASTHEAEENCAIIVIENLKDYLENGNINYSVNFPEANMPRNSAYRLTVTEIKTYLTWLDRLQPYWQQKISILRMLNKSLGSLAYTIVDVDKEISNDVLGKISDIDGILS